MAASYVGKGGLAAAHPSGRQEFNIIWAKYKKIIFVEIANINLGSSFLKMFFFL